MANRSAGGQPAGGQPAGGQPAAGQPAAGQPAAAEPAAAGPAARPPGWLLGYPTDHLLGILPDDHAAGGVTADLGAIGVSPSDVRIFAGEDAALRIDGRGTHHGLIARLYRLVQLTQMDQAPDFRRYEEEARRGHPVIAVRETSPERRRAIRAVLRRHGAHFVNFYGRVYTETLDPFEEPSAEDDAT